MFIESLKLEKKIVTHQSDQDLIICILGVSPSLAETANRAESGQLQFWSEPSEILSLRSSNTPEAVAFTIF